VLFSVNWQKRWRKTAYFCGVKNLKIRRLWLLVAACLVGINTFQGYWLWRQYQVQQRNFAVTVKGALAQATQQVRLGEAAGMLQNLDLMRTSSVRIDRDTMRWESKNQNDTLIYVALSQFNKPTSPTLQLRTIDSIFTLELRKRGIRETYRLDTITHRTPDVVQHTVNTNTSSQKIDIRINTDKRMIMVMNEVAEPDTGRFIMVTTPLNLMNRTFVRASFPRHNYHVIASVAGVLIAGLLLTLLTAGAFFYLLYIIQQQKKLAALKSDFISAMTHELQTPIATSAAAIEALQRFNALEHPERTASYLDIAQTQLTQLSGMVDQTLRLAAEEQEGFLPHKQLIDLTSFVPPMLERAVLAAGREVRLSFDNHLHAPVSIDPEYFTWAVQNLLDNAIKYCPKDRIPVVTIRAGAAGQQRWTLSVTDNGPGIPEAHRSRLFERFFRVPTDSNVKGFGLGLYVVQRIAMGHGGQVFLRESGPQGSVFVIELPLV
jgi:two-component system, OmpR family, phosphate regulon sensor histidine kinase PhoR